MSARTKPTKDFCNLMRSTRKKVQDSPIIITPAQVQQTIKKSKASKALVPEELSSLMLKHIGLNGMSFLAYLFTKVLKTLIVQKL